MFVVILYCILNKYTYYIYIELHICVIIYYNTIEYMCIYME